MTGPGEKPPTEPKKPKGQDPASVLGMSDKQANDELAKLGGDAGDMFRQVKGEERPPAADAAPPPKEEDGPFAKDAFGDLGESQQDGFKIEEIQGGNDDADGSMKEYLRRIDEKLETIASALEQIVGGM